MIALNIMCSSDIFLELGMNSPHVGLLFVFGLLFGPYGALGSMLANMLIDLLGNFTVIEIIPSAIISFGVSYLAYKLWYSGFKENKVTKPKITDTHQLIRFLLIITICGLVYSVVHGCLLSIFTPGMGFEEYMAIYYFINFINVAFIFGVIFIWLSERINIIETPKISKKIKNERMYGILFALLIIVPILSFITLVLKMDSNILIVDIITIGIILYAYLTKPHEDEIDENEENTITKNILNVFLATILIIAILGLFISFFSYNFLEEITTLPDVVNNPFFVYLYSLRGFIITDGIILLFFIPCIIILKYVENKVIKPISAFSEIKQFIKENEKIESEGLVNVYSKYVEENNEIGTLAQSYTELIKHNNNYINNINEIEGEKKRVEAELDIATKIQAAALPTEAIKTDDFIVNGYSKPAKEVGGDFFDYYMLDEDNLAIVIGDASGKGVPAALLAMITQVIIKQTLKHNKNPESILYSLNNQLCENNPESMFLTLWLGIYNKTTKKLTFSNAGHNPPLIKENDKFKFLDIDTGVVLGIMEDFDYVKEEITLTDELVIYTDGITDANNNTAEMYGEERLINFFNKFEKNTNPILPLLNEINEFTEDAKQFDDMTIAYLKIK